MKGKLALDGNLAMLLNVSYYIESILVEFYHKFFY